VGVKEICEYGLSYDTALASTWSHLSPHHTCHPSYAKEEEKTTHMPRNIKIVD
jgi:hypothetical protein